MQVTASCTDCGGPFQRDAEQAWRRLCVPCWRATQPAKDAAKDYWYAKGFQAGVADAQARASPEPLLDAPKIRRLLQLVHPDRHGGSALATEVTSWLLELRAECR